MNFVDPEGTFIFNTTLIIINPILYYRWSPHDKNGRKYFLEVTKCKNFYNLNKGVDYFISTINYCQKNFFQVDLCIYDKNVNKNKQYLLGFVSSGFIEGFSSLLLDKYKDVFSKNFSLRSTKGLVYEIVLHIYMYYFDLDKSSNYSHSKIIDIDYYKDGLAIEALCSDSNIKKCIDAIKNNKQNSSISYILKSVLKLVK